MNYRRALVDGSATNFPAPAQKVESTVDEEEADKAEASEVEVSLVDGDIATPFPNNNLRSQDDDTLDDEGNLSRIDDEQLLFSEVTISPHDMRLALVPSREEKAAAEKSVGGKIRDIEARKPKPKVVPGPDQNLSKIPLGPKPKVVLGSRRTLAKNYNSLQKPKQPEAFVLSRHRRNFSEDLADERLTRTPDIEMAFSTVVQRKEECLTPDRHILLEIILEYYGFPGTYKTDPAVDMTLQCPFTSRNIEIVRINILGFKEYPTPFRLVPKALEGDELSYLFGVKELLLDALRNGKCLDATSGLRVRIDCLAHSFVDQRHGGRCSYIRPSSNHSRP